jgi:hypothetical protein
MVPVNWQHPKDENGDYIPLLRQEFQHAHYEWWQGFQKWKLGLVKGYGKEPWVQQGDYYSGMRYSDHAGPPPSPDGHMPSWATEEATHFMMYENTSEGTPISPAFATGEELAHWLADTGASAWADMAATYEQWLATIKAGSAPSAVSVGGGPLESGVAAMERLTKK